MSKSKIEWTANDDGTPGRTWNPVRGCSMAKGSETGGCLFCYAARMSARNLPGHRSPTTGEPFAKLMPSGPRWTGKVELIESKLREPLTWRKPCRVFVNSMSDLFHEALPDREIFKVFVVMAAAERHTFQILTKRPERMMRWMGYGKAEGFPVWPLPNVWLGVSVEDQATADERIPLLLQTPAAIRFVSYEPALGPVDFEKWLACEGHLARTFHNTFLDWIICGGESGPGARPPYIGWFRQARNQCVAADVPFFFKQHGEWGPHDKPAVRGTNNGAGLYVLPDGSLGNQGDYWDGRAAGVNKVGKKKAGALLDGREWKQFPGTQPRDSVTVERSTPDAKSDQR
jgi:protein gp37